MLYNDTSFSNSTSVSPKQTTVMIDGLKANTNYSFQVLAFTAKGSGVTSEAYFARTFQGIYDIKCSIVIERFWIELPNNRTFVLNLTAFERLYLSECHAKICICIVLFQFITDIILTYRCS